MKIPVWILRTIPALCLFETLPKGFKCKKDDAISVTRLRGLANKGSDDNPLAVGHKRKVLLLYDLGIGYSIKSRNEIGGTDAHTGKILCVRPVKGSSDVFVGVSKNSQYEIVQN